MTNLSFTQSDKDIYELEAGLRLEGNQQCLAERLAIAEIEWALQAEADRPFDPAMEYAVASGREVYQLMELNKEDA